MRLIIPILAMALCATAQQQPLRVPGKVDPRRQCANIARDRPELSPLQRACEQAVAAHETLPNFICDLKVTRSDADTRDTFTAELRYVDGQEETHELRENGHPLADGSSIPGAWTEGEFAPPGLVVLNGTDEPTLRFREETAGTLKFDYTVAKESNISWDWNVATPSGALLYRPAFHGWIWVDKTSSGLRHLSMEATAIDAFVPYRSVTKTIDYAQFSIVDGAYLLPVRTVVEMCPRVGKQCIEIIREFSNCRRFAAKARIVE